VGGGGVQGEQSGQSARVVRIEWFRNSYEEEDPVGGISVWVVMQNKRFGGQRQCTRHIPEIRVVAGPILRRVLEEADERARSEVEMGWRLQKMVIAMPAGIKQEFPIYPTMPAHLKWSSKAAKGQVYIVTDKRSQQQWLWEIGKSEEPWCVCDGWTPQNAAHLLGCPWVGDGRGRTSEQVWEDEKWCEAVADFIM